uniref:Integral membrane protein TerC n=1 Tax=Cyanothece sp. (strain PCC 7425 / ATCC 29141) TaxID=395961 RepID=B8HWB7_CYAP4
MLDHVFDIAPTIGLDGLLLLVVLVALEAVLSADNAIALAALVQGFTDLKTQQRALNLGLVAAFILRIVLIISATWVIRFWQFELAGALYLLWLSWQYFTSNNNAEHHHHGPRFTSLWQAIPLIALTDLAFSFDSVTTAIAVSEERWLVLTGGMIGIITLRFMAELFIRWLKEFTYLQDAGYITVTLVGLRLLLKVFDSELVPPEWMMISAIALCFIWGFSRRNPESEPETTPPVTEPEPSSHPLLEISNLEEQLHLPDAVSSEGDYSKPDLITKKSG